MKAEPFNLVLLHCHDLGQYLNCYGIPTVQTPNLDAFAAEGVLFENYFCTAPSCSPSRASLFTGRYPHSNGVMGLCHGDFAWDLNLDERHLAEILAAAGYSTAAVGVIHETCSGPARCGYQRYVNKQLAADMADAALELLEEFAASDQPFFLYAGSVEPHRLKDKRLEDRPGDASYPGNHLEPDSELGVYVPPYLEDTEGARKELAGLQGAVKHVDAQFGRIWAAIKRLGLETNTLVVFTTDHGVAMPRAKCSLYEPGLKITHLMKFAPRGWAGGKRYTELLQNVDFVPTILDLLDLEIPANLHGRSFAPLLDGGDYTPRKHLFAEMTYHDYYDPRRSVRTEDYKLIVNFTTAPAFMDPSQRWRPLSDPVVPENHAMAYHPHVELYDLRKDPWEREDVAHLPEYAEVKRELLAALLENMRLTQDPLLAGAVTSPHHRRALELLAEAGK